MRSILLLTLVARCLETIDVCIWHMLVEDAIKTIQKRHTPEPVS